MTRANREQKQARNIQSGSPRQVRAPGASRSCVGCSRFDVPKAMVRYVDTVGGLCVDPTSLGLRGNKPNGRGLYVHPSPVCLENAAKRGVSRSLRRAVSTSSQALALSLRQQIVRRIESLFALAVRRRGLKKVSATSSEQLVVVACDADAAFLSALMQSAGTPNRVAWSTRVELGALVGGELVDGLVVNDTRVAQGLRKAIEWATAVLPASGVEVS